MTDQGCMLRAYSRDIVDAVSGEPRGQHLHPGARLHVRAQPDRGRGRARGARGGRVQVFALQPDPPQLRPGHRLLAGAAAVLLAVRHVRLGAEPRALYAVVVDPARSSSAPRRARRCGTATSCVLPDRRRAVRRRPGRRVRRAHLPAGARAAALHDPRRAGAARPTAGEPPRMAGGEGVRQA